jgi:hypothetical protein
VASLISSSSARRMLRCRRSKQPHSCSPPHGCSPCHAEACRSEKWPEGVTREGYERGPPGRRCASVVSSRRRNGTGRTNTTIGDVHGCSIAGIFVVLRSPRASSRGPARPGAAGERGRRHRFRSLEIAACRVVSVVTRSRYSLRNPRRNRLVPFIRAPAPRAAPERSVAGSTYLLEVASVV